MCPASLHIRNITITLSGLPVDSLLLLLQTKAQENLHYSYQMQLICFEINWQNTQIISVFSYASNLSNSQKKIFFKVGSQLGAVLPSTQYSLYSVFIHFNYYYLKALRYTVAQFS